MSTLQIIPSNEGDKELVRLYLANRKDMSYEERKMFLDFLALFLRPVFLCDEAIKP